LTKLNEARRASLLYYHIIQIAGERMKRGARIYVKNSERAACRALMLKLLSLYLCGGRRAEMAFFHHAQ
jgi:hypothetical protein